MRRYTRFLEWDVSFPNPPHIKTNLSPADIVGPYEEELYEWVKKNRPESKHAHGENARMKTVLADLWENGYVCAEIQGEKLYIGTIQDSRGAIGDESRPLSEYELHQYACLIGLSSQRLARSAAKVIPFLKNELLAEAV